MILKIIVMSQFIKLKPSYTDNFDRQRKAVF